MRQAWSRELVSPPLRVSLARESGAALTFDIERMLTRLDATGQIVLRRPAPATPTAAVLSDEGRHIAALGRRGQVWVLSPEFDVIWQRSLTRRPLALAIDHLGLAVAVADEGGEVHVFNALGQELWRTQTPRPLHHLTWVPEGGTLVGAADLGLVCAFDRQGKLLWREGLVARVTSLAVSGAGERIVLASHEGLYVSSLERPRQTPVAKSAGSRFVAVSYRGDVLISVTDNRLYRRDGTGLISSEFELMEAPLALTLSALAERALLVVGRMVVCVEMGEKPAK